VNPLPVAATAIAGAIAGSFIATLCVRWSRGEQATVGRSRCDSCNLELSAVELIPIVSSLYTRGRCRTCGARIPGLHLWIEIAAAVLAAIAVGLQPTLQGAALALFWLLLLGPAVLDARHHWLPDPLTLVLGGAGLLAGGLATGVPLVDRLIGGAVGFLALWIVAQAYRRLRGREGLGAGDPKLMGAIGLWAGWVALPAILLIAALAGLGVAVAQGRSRLDRMPFGSLLAGAAIVWTGVLAARSSLDGAQLF
jgi:leader peptidase (prepilin peptidase) / N-methyltransferase